ncbi:MAG: sigma-54 dependent transcriptional regulator [Desulfotomaculaceae bacterium]|nr:sigma-54 dependent transcriptional regulator [Desulfotomaculaceae bacterium]
MTFRILVVDDEIEIGEFFTFLLEPYHYKVTVAVNGSQAREAFKEPYHLAIIDLKLPDTDGITLLRELKSLQPDCESIIMTGYSTVKSAVEAIQLGAFDYIEKPFSDLSELELVIKQALSQLKNEIFYEQRNQALDSAGLVTGQSEEMRKLLLVAEKLAKKDITILIRGETGTGKDVLAHFIHAMSPRAEKPFLAINCGALPENLLESELFGYEKGAFTGASGQKKGIFELAHRGTLFLDEVGDASNSIQVKLLRVLETGEIMRVGGQKPIHVDVRILAATNANLEELIKLKRFREDLYYRLEVVSLTSPPLRDRKEDILFLAEHFMTRHFPPGRVPALSTEVLNILKSYDWPGNVRELANMIAKIAAVCDSPVILPEHLPLNFSKKRPSTRTDQQPQIKSIVRPVKGLLAETEERLTDFIEGINFDAGFDLPCFLEDFKQVELTATQLIIERALKEAKGHYPTAAEMLKTTPRALRYLKKEKH